MRPYTIYRSHANGRQSIWSAVTDDRQTLGTLVLSDHTDTIDWVGTHPRYRRKGIATALLAAARADGRDPQHSQHRTPEGDAWARSTGDPLPGTLVSTNA